MAILVKPMEFDAELIQSHLKATYNFVYRYVGNAHDAEDITQDTFIKAWKNISKFDVSRNFKTWLFAIARNTALDFLKKKKAYMFADFENEVGENVLAKTLKDTAPLPDSLFDQKDTVDKLERAMTVLSPDQRAVLTLHYQEDLTFEEIGEVLKKPANTAKSLHRRALLALRAQLSL